MMPHVTPPAAPAQLRQASTTSLEAEWGIRKILTETTEILADGGTATPAAIKQAWAAAIVRNPWVGGPADENLIDSPRRVAARLSKLLSDRLLAVLGTVDAVQAFGKGAIIGEDGEMEHGAALTHSPYFASNLRTFLGGTAVISFADTRGRDGDVLVVPLCEKHTGIVRDHYQGVRVRIPGAPRRDEIVLIAAAATGTRPFPRVGDRITDQPLNNDLMNGVFA